MRGRKPVPAAFRKGRKRTLGPIPPDALPRCPPHLDAVARKEWRRLATPLCRMGVLTVADRAALAAYCQCWSRWVEAETQLRKTPPLLKTPSGYVQQSPWLSIANRQLELMARFMAELGLTPAARMRVAAAPGRGNDEIAQVVICFETADGRLEDADGRTVEETADPSRTIRLPSYVGRL